MATLHFDLYQDTVYPYAPSPSNYLNSWTKKITAADGAAWTGLFDSAGGDKAFSTLNFGGTVRTGANALVVDWNAAGDGVTISTGLRWNDVKNIHLDSFDGASLNLRNFVDVLLALGANTAGQTVSVDGAKRGKIDLGSGADTLFVGVDSNNASNGANDFYINTGGGADSVRIARSTIDYSVTAFRENYAERWTNTQVRLGDGNDSIIADGSNDTVWGGADNDTAELRGGANWFDGEAGFDKAVFRGLKADYLIETVTGGFKVTDLRTTVDGDDGITTVINAEQLVFKDQVVSIGGNQAPDAANDSATTAEDTAVSIAVLANDTDADGNPLSITGFTQGASGTVALVAGQLVYTPNLNFNGTDQFSYTISDGQGGSGTATVDITITPVNDAPVANDDSGAAFIAFEDAITALNYPVLFNDTDVDGPALAIISFTQGQHGTVALGSNLTYLPTDPNFNDIDSFTYTVIDGAGGTDTATVFINVLPVNDPVVAVDDVVTIGEDSGTVTILPLANDTDIDGDVLTLLAVTSGPTHGFFFQDGNQVRYQPFADFSGTDQFTYSVFDQGGAVDTATVFITVTAVNDAPVANPDSFSTNGPLALPLSTFIGTLLANDTDIDGDQVFFGDFQQPANGTLVQTGATVTYTPNAGFVGQDSFTYTVFDANGGISGATVTINVTDGNTAPVAQGDSFTTQEANPLIVATPGLLANDSDAEGDALSVTGFTQGSHGSVFVGADGSFAYQPLPGYAGSDSFTYTVSDGTATSTATVEITVVEGTPVAGNDAVATLVDTPLQIQAATLLANDSDPNGDTLFVVGVDSTGTQGSVAISAGGNLLFTPNAGFVGTTSFVYGVTDGINSAQATVSITVSAGNLAPVAADDTFSMQADGEIAIPIADLLANDSDPGDTFFFTTAGNPVNGALGQAGGTLFFEPTAGFAGTASFEYTIQDSAGATDNATVFITVLPPAGPVAEDDSFTVAEDSLQNFLVVLANDSVPSGSSINIGPGPANGSITNLLGTLLYTPNADFSGTDSFTYTLTDSFGQSDTATVTISVTGVNDAPVLLDPGTFTGNEDTQLSGQLNAFDADGDMLSFTGTLDGLVLAADGSFTYTPQADFTGTTSFVVTVQDGQGGETAGTIFLQINPVNDAPVARDDVTATLEDLGILGASVGANDTDVDGDALTFALEGGGLPGLVFNSDGTFSYLPPPDFSGVASFDYRVTDTSGASDVATVQITVFAVPDAPVALDDAAATAFQTAVTITVLANDSDADGDALVPLLDADAPNGAVVVNADGTITYTPDAGFSGTDTFRYRAFDGTGFGNVATVTVVVGPPGNRPPVADDVSFTIGEDSPFLANLFGFTSDPDFNQSSIQLLGSTNLSVTSFDGATGAIEVQPTANYSGTATITYQVTDAGGQTDSGVVTLTVTPVNDAPLAVDDSYGVQEGRTLTVSAPGLLANDFDPDGTAPTAFQYFQPANGTVNLLEDGSFTYTPNAGFSGEDSFTYIITDGSETASATVFITVTEGNPVAGNDSYTVLHDQVLTIAAPGLLANDTDPNGDVVTAFQYFQPANGVVSLMEDGSFVYTPNAGFIGLDTFTYIITDGVLTGSGTVTIDVTNTAPDAVGDAFSVQEGRVLTIAAPGLLANDSDADAVDVVTAFQFFQPANGTVSLVQDGSFTYTPNAGFSGVDSFTYIVTDGIATDSATVTVTVIEGSPVAGDDAYQVAAGQTLTITAPGLLANDSDPNGEAVVAFQYFQPANGLVFLNADGSFSYTPDAGFTGVDTFTYIITDGVLTGSGTVAITVTPGNTAPVASDLLLTEAEDYPGTLFSLAALTNDAEGNAVSYAITNVVGGALGGFDPVSGLGSFLPTPDFNGEARIDWTVTDAGGLSDSASIVITITPGDDGPRPQSDSVTATEDQTVVISIASLLANDLHPDGAAALAGTEFEFVESVGSNFDPGFTWTGTTITAPPVANFAGSADFYYRVRDADGDIATAAVTVFFAPVEDAPVANDDTLTRATTATQTITAAQLLANDADADNTNSRAFDDDVLSVTAVQAISGGTVVLNADQSVTVTFTGGPMVFEYTLSDGTTTDTATVTLNDAPVAVDDSVTVAENTLFTATQFFNVTANDADPNGDPLTVTGITVLGGAPVIAYVNSASQVAFYTTDPWFNGQFTLRYTVTDGLGSDTGDLVVTVTPQNDPPRDLASAGDTGPNNDAGLNLSTAEDTPLVISVAALLADDLNAPDEAQVVTLFDLLDWFNATVVNNGNGTINFTPNANFNSASGFWYRAADEQNAVGDYVWVPITVTAVNDPVLANDDIIARQFAGGGTQTITRAQLVGNDSTPDGDEVITAVAAVSGVTSVVLNADESVTVTYAAGALPVFSYTLSDGVTTDTATVTLNSGPQVTGTPGTLTWNEDQRDFRYDADLIAMAGITDPNGDALQIVDFQSSTHFGVDDAFWDTFAGFYNYAYFQPFPQDFNGATTLTFTVSDGNTATDLTVTLNVNVQAVNDAPRDSAQYSPGYVGGNDGTDGDFSTAEGTAITILKSTLLADDFDPEGNSFSITGFGNNSGIGNVVDNGDSYTFTPYSFYQNYVGETAGFYYTLQDSLGAVSYHYVFVEFTNTPDPINANNDVVTRTAGGSQTIAAATILGNDQDPDPGDTKTITDLIGNNGIDIVSLDANGDIVVQYSAVPGGGRASFIYTVQDSTGNSDTATVELNRPPVAAGEGPISMSEGQDYLFIPFSTLLANDSDADGDALSVSLYNWGYAGSNVFVQYSVEGGQNGVRVTLYQDEYSGPAEFQYYVYDGNAYSDYVTVTLDVVAGDDVPRANPDYWYYNGASYNDTNPATNPMVGTEDQVLEFPVSLLTQGQFVGGVLQAGADENDDGTLAQLTIADISSPFGLVEVVDIGGVDHVRFTPNADVNSAYAYSQSSLDWSRIYLTYSVYDGTTVSNSTQAYLLLLPQDDTPTAQDDVFTVAGDGPYTLNIAQVGGAYDVRANDISPDDYPNSIYDYTYLAGAVAISGGSVSFDGYFLTFTPDGSGDPLVFEYTLQDADGDTETAQVTLNVLPPASQVFYFSGSVPASGRELWVYDPSGFDPGLGGPFATMVDDAETAPGSDSGTPREITALADSVFWRDEYTQSWHTYNPALGWQQLSSVNTSAFDTALDEADRNLGIRSGDYFWGATQGEGATLTAWDQAGNYETQIYLLGFDRTLLTDAGHDPAYLAMVSTYDPATDTYSDAEQVHAVLWDPGFNGFGNYQITDGGDASNDVTEIAGLQVVQNPNNSSQYAKTIYFAGDFTDSSGNFQANALWRITTTNDGFGWDSNQAPEFLDNGSGGAVESNAHGLMVTDVPYAGNTVERLFWFQNDSAGNGQIATRYDNHFGGFGTSTGNNYLGSAFQGFEIRPWENGVLFSGSVPGLFSGDTGAVVASYTDADGDGFFDVTTYWNALSDGVIEQLVVDGQGNAAWVLDAGGFDYLYVYREAFGSADFIASRFGEITGVQLAGGHLVYVSEDSSGTVDTLHDFTLDISTLLEVLTDEPTGGGAGDGFTSAYANVAVNGGLAFEATDGFNYQLYTTDGASVFSPGFGTFRYSEGAVLNGNWVGTAFVADIGISGLYEIAADGNLTALFLDDTVSFSNEAEVLGQQVLFGITSAATNQVLVYDAVSGNTTTLLFDHLLGGASTVGSNIIFNALDFTNAANTDGDSANNVWTLYAYGGSTVTTLLDLPVGGGGGQNVQEWWRHQDFLGSDDRIFWKQANDTTGVEVHTMDLTAADPASTLIIVDINPGSADGANWGDAVFANGRLYWQASPDGSVNQMRLYTTTDGTDAAEVTSADLSAGNPYQFPWLPTAIGNEVFFLGNSTVTGTWGVFQVNDDGETAALISPDTFSYSYGLTSIGTDLYFFEQEGGTDQMWRMTTGATPQDAHSPVLLTSFTQSGDFMGDIFAAVGEIYFSRDEAGTGRELWVLDSNDPTGARLVADLNTAILVEGYAPEQVVAVPDPLEQDLAGTFQPIGVFPT